MRAKHFSLHSQLSLILPHVRIYTSAMSRGGGSEGYEETAQRSNAILFLANHIALNITGILLVLISANLLGVFALMVVVEWPGAAKLRLVLMRTTLLVCADSLVLRPLVVPYFRVMQHGPALFVVSAWYLPLYLYAGAVRLLCLFLFVLLSFFEPGTSALPRPLDALDSSHAAFVAYCLEQVERDAHERRRRAERHTKHGDASDSGGASAPTDESATPVPRACPPATTDTPPRRSPRSFIRHPDTMRAIELAKSTSTVGPQQDGWVEAVESARQWLTTNEAAAIDIEQASGDHELERAATRASMDEIEDESDELPDDRDQPPPPEPPPSMVGQVSMHVWDGEEEEDDDGDWVEDGSDDDEGDATPPPPPPPMDDADMMIAFNDGVQLAPPPPPSAPLAGAPPLLPPGRAPRPPDGPPPPPAI